MKSIGFYILPFRISDTGLFEKHLDNIGFREAHDLFSIHYLLRYTVEQTPDGKKMFKCFILSEKAEGIADYLCFDVNLSLQKISIVMFENSIGYLIYKMEYLTDDVEQIIEISSKTKVYENQFKYNSLKKSADYILGIESGNINIFFHLSEIANKNSHIFQYINVEDFNLISDEQRFRLRNGYDNSFRYNENDRTHTNFEYKPFPYIYWTAGQSSLVCITEDNCKENRTFLHKVLPVNIENDYLLMYLLTLHQRYSSFAFMFDISKYKDNDKKIAEINRNITKFQLESSFYMVSDERVYQDLYSMLRKTMDIEILFRDIKEINERFKNIRDDYNNKRERVAGTAITVLSLMTVFSALIDFSSFLDRFSGASFVNTIASSVIIVAIAFISVFTYLHYIKKL